MWRQIRIVILFVAFALDQTSAADLTKIYAGYGGIAGYQMPLWVIKEAEIGKKYGIEIEPLLISGGALDMQALLANNIQLSQNSASAAIGAAFAARPSRSSLRRKIAWRRRSSHAPRSKCRSN